MANKTYSVTFILKELSASHYRHNTSVTAPSLGRAVDLAWKVIKQRSDVKGRRISKGEVLFEVLKDLTTD